MGKQKGKIRKNVRLKTAINNARKHPKMDKQKGKIRKNR